MVTAMEAYMAPVLPFLCAVDDLSGCYGLIKDGLEARLPLRRTQFRDSTGNVSELPELHLRYVPTGDPYVQRLRQLSYSPVTWFRNPFVQLVLFSCEDAEEYRRVYRPQLKAIADPEARIAIAPELVIAYVSPPGGDPRLAAKVIDTVRRDFAYKRRERCVKLDPPTSVPGAAPKAMPGLETLDGLLKEAITLTFESRVGAYLDACRRLMAHRMDHGWSFANLFFVKDAYAFMLESAGLIEDARREYAELEVCLMELQASSSPVLRPGSDPEADEDASMWYSWSDIRKAVLSNPTVPPVAMRQLLFASQARLLVKLRNWSELADMGASFISSLRDELCEAGIPALKASAWAFAAYTNLGSLISKALWSSTGNVGSVVSEETYRAPPLSRHGRTVNREEEDIKESQAVEVELQTSSSVVRNRSRATYDDSNGMYGSPALKEALEWELGPLVDVALHQGISAAPFSSLAPSEASQDRTALFSALGSLFTAARAELEACEAFERGQAGLTLAKRGVSPTSVEDTDAPWDKTTPDRKQYPHRDVQVTASHDRDYDYDGESAALDEDGMQSVALDASSTHSERGEGNAGEGHENVPESTNTKPSLAAPLANASASSRPSSVTHHRHVSVSSLESASAAGDDVNGRRTPRQQQLPGRPPPAGPLASAPVVTGATTTSVAPRTQSAPAAPTPVDYMDPRFVEQQVLSTAGPLPLPRLPESAPANHSFPRHWRVRRALASRAAFRGLWIGLSLGAGAAYTAAGHWRSAALLRGEAAGLLSGAMSAAGGGGDFAPHLPGEQNSSANSSNNSMASPEDALAAAHMLVPLCNLAVPALWPGVSGPLLVSLLKSLRLLDDVVLHGKRINHDSGAISRCSIDAAAALLRTLRSGGSRFGFLADEHRVSEMLLGSLRMSSLTEPLMMQRTGALDGSFALEATLVDCSSSTSRGTASAPARFQGRVKKSNNKKVPGGPAQSHRAAELTSNDHCSSGGVFVASVGDAVPIQIAVRNVFPGSSPALLLRDVTLVADTLQLVDNALGPEIKGGSLPNNNNNIIDQHQARPIALKSSSPVENNSGNCIPLLLTEQAESHPVRLPGPDKSLDWASVEVLQCQLSEEKKNDNILKLAPGSVTPLTFIARPLKTGLLVPRSLQSTIIVAERHRFDPEQADINQRHGLRLVVPIVPQPGVLHPDEDAQLSSHGTQEEVTPRPEMSLSMTSPKSSFPTNKTPLSVQPPTSQHPTAWETAFEDAPSVHVSATVEPPRPHVCVEFVDGAGTLFAGETRWLGVRLCVSNGEAVRGLRMGTIWPDRSSTKPTTAARELNSSSSGRDLPSALHHSVGGSLPTGLSTIPQPSFKVRRSAASVPAAALGLQQQSDEDEILNQGPSVRPLQACILELGCEPKREVLHLEESTAEDKGKDETVLVSDAGPATWQQPVVIPDRAWSCRSAMPNNDKFLPQSSMVTAWWLVRAGSWLPEPVTVRVQAPPVTQSESDHHSALPQLEISWEGGEGGGVPLALDLGLQWQEGGVAERSAVLTLALHVAQPFSVHLRAQEIASNLNEDDGSSSTITSSVFVLLGATLTSRLQASTVIDSVTLGPQLGVEVVESTSIGPNHVVAPGASLELSWLLRLDDGGDGGNLDRARLAARLRQSACFGRSVLSVDYRTDRLRCPALDHDDEDAELTTEQQTCVFRHTHVLELPEQPEANSVAEAMVLLRFLGPFEARGGESVVFCWRVERPLSGSTASDDNSAPAPLSFDTSAVQGSWEPAGVRSGRVLLGKAGGSVATVEIAFTPKSVGSLVCPRLVLHGVHCQELYDATQEVGIIRVLEPEQLADVPL